MRSVTSEVRLRVRVPWLCVLHLLAFLGRHSVRGVAVPHNGFLGCRDADIWFLLTLRLNA